MSRPWVGLIGLALLAVGCAREAVPEYRLGEEAQSLPERHQEQVEAGLTELFGTPLFPKPLDAPLPEDGFAEEVAAASTESRSHIELGASIFRVRCAGCHGETGDGQGPAAEYMQPKPRDFRQGVFKFTSTPYGDKPARADLVRTIRRGAKGVSMPSFPWMPEDELQAVIDYVILLSQRGEVESFVAKLAELDYDEEDDIDDSLFLAGLKQTRDAWEAAENQVVTPVTAEPHYTDESIIAGRKAFLSQGCSKCHGEDGKGQSEWISPEFIAAQEELPEDQREQINFDDWGHPAPAADLTARMLHGGRRPIDIYRRIYTGINGTPMPSFANAFNEEPDTIWHLVHYVLSIVEGREVDFSSLDENDLGEAAARPVSGDRS